MKIENSIVWVTGASSGIGEGLAYVLSQAGARLVLSSRRLEALEEVRLRCTSPERHWSIPLDLEHPSSIHSAVNKVQKDIGNIDILINNGGVSQRALAKDTQIDVDRRLMEINYFGTIILTKAILPSMLERGSGHIVVVTSLMGKMSSPVRSAYAASKHALHGFFDALRAETYDDGIRVTLVCPGFVSTNVSINALTGDGTPTNKLDDSVANGIEPLVCARKIMRAIEKDRDEIVIAGKEKIGIYLRALSPGLFNSVIRRAKVT